jgi:D-alanyl-D-alanine carboxypeptidase/D-alanyl-D-alanine-endopeptidase (penicillin-binding protein 4)
VTPNQLTGILSAAYHNLGWGPYFISSLPTAGMDGTLKDRFKSADLRARVKAKTGSISGVTSLAGYVQARNGDILAVASLFNKDSGNGDLRSLQDELFSSIIETQWGAP